MDSGKQRFRGLFKLEELIFEPQKKKQNAKEGQVFRKALVITKALEIGWGQAEVWGKLDSISCDFFGSIKNLL